MTRVAMLMCVVALGGCAGSSHLTETYGRSYRQVWNAQRTGTEVRQAVKGLDSEEATIVASSYRQSLAPKEGQAQPEAEILYVAPPARGGTPALAPSVPKER